MRKINITTQRRHEESFRLSWHDAALYLAAGAQLLGRHLHEHAAQHIRAHGLSFFCRLGVRREAAGHLISSSRKDERRYEHHTRSRRGKVNHVKLSHRI